MPVLSVGSLSVFPSIAAALLAASPGDTIQLQAGYSNETVVITLTGLIITGDASSTGIVLQLGVGIPTFTTTGTAPFRILDAIDGNGIVGNAGDNIITVSAGVDAVDGGLGTDRLFVNYALAIGPVTGDSTSNFTEAGGGGRSVTITAGTIEHFTVLTGAAADTITTGAGDDIINVGAGANTVTAGNGANSVTGGDDADTITTGTGNDTIVAGAGTNIVVAGQGANSITGGGGSDTFTALDGGNFMDAGDGTNTLTSGAGNDTILSGTGAATIVAGGGQDLITVRGGAATLDTGTGVDRLTLDYAAMTTNVIGGITSGNLGTGYTGHVEDGATATMDFIGTENFTITTGSGNDTITTGDGTDVLRGGTGNDSFIAAGGVDQLFGDAGDDILNGGAGGDLIHGGSGFDYASFQGGAAAVSVYLASPGLNTADAMGDTYTSVEGFLGTGFGDLFVGDDNVNVFAGMNGNDVLLGGAGDDALYGGDGDDSFYPGPGVDYVNGGNGYDYVRFDYATAGVTASLATGTGTGGEAAGDIYIACEALIGSQFADVLVGDGANNVLVGNGGADVLIGGAGIDSLFSGMGNDVLNGGVGADVLYGGEGADAFYFVNGEGGDTVGDFSAGVDMMVLIGSSFGFAPGASLDGRFVYGVAPTSSLSQFIYDPFQHTLFFDANGIGAGGQSTVCVLQAGAALMQQDLVFG
ncbi:calcium-binding protein [Sediminicoccus sp. KRV36]|uniref:calcium-binding protein n=1 Tax=Sediminicoccus sp. KRV36 TaxID=3133721 RepID=UPI00200E331F|nr:calcium-binding protein [Sediminicoccus rosea]UPY38130.1 calcium-binding protein [Sediminicoccus rosea]